LLLGPNNNYLGVLQFFLDRLNVDGLLSSLGCSIDFEASLGVPGIPEAVVVGWAETLEVLATTEAMEVFLFGTL
jgi:hypothetical protein